MTKAQLRKKQIKEAATRLELLTKKFNMNPKILNQFNKNQTIYYSDDQILGVFSNVYVLDNNSEFKRIVKEFEDEFDAFVYYAILTGSHLSLLFVSCYEQEWEYEKVSNLGWNYAYVHNFVIEEHSEFGDIRIIGLRGNLSRIG